MKSLNLFTGKSKRLLVLSSTRQQAVRQVSFPLQKNTLLFHTLASHYARTRGTLTHGPTET